MREILKDKIIKALIEAKHLKKADIEAAINLQNKKGIGLAKILIEKGLISEKELMMLLVKEIGVPPINLTKYKIDPSLQEFVPERIARQYRIIPVSKIGDKIMIALSDPSNIFAIDDLKTITGNDVQIVMSTDSEIMCAINNYYKQKEGDSITKVSQDITGSNFEIIVDGREDFNDTHVDEDGQAPIIRMVDLIIKEALKQRASDVHFDPTEENIRVRYRIDGILRDILKIPKENQKAVIVRIKIMSRLDITMTNNPQDGRFKMKMVGKEIDVRVSILPTTFGPKVVMRILDKKNLSSGLGGLGFSKESLTLFKDAIVRPFGMILISGPTGSGKSTTLYSIINQLNTDDKNVITVEDPVEYLIEGLTQIQVRSEIGLTFASGLRAILRQSPDIVMVGEIRDSETADIAIKASLTGQLVFSTLHTNDSAGALTRLVDMRVEPFLVASSLIMVCAQRLCRKICSYCKEQEEIPSKILAKLECAIDPKIVFYHGKGCERCQQTGYLGRVCVSETLEIDDEIREMIIEGKSSDEVKKYARECNNTTSLRMDINRKFTEGITTIEEVFRVTSEE